MKFWIAAVFAGTWLSGAASAQSLKWSELPELPDKHGFGGPFVGVHNDALIVAGGANFPNGKPWDDPPGEKVWHDSIFVLPKGEKQWRTGFKLPTRVAYGGAVSLPDGVILIGGQNESRSFADVRRLRWTGEKIEFEDLPSLPQASCYLAATHIGRTLYVLAGAKTTTDPGDLTALQPLFWKLDLSRPEDDREWEELPACPGGPRVKAVLVAQKKGSRAFVYAFSGEQPKSKHLADGWRFDPDQKTWQAVASPPECFAAAPAIAIGQSQILVFSGDTGEHVSKPPDQRPRFARRILSYHTAVDRWAQVGEIPEAVVTTMAVKWGNRFVIASGEIKPGVRTIKVQAFEIPAAESSFGATNALVLGLYLLALVAIGGYSARQTRGTDDFFLAGRKVPWWAAGLSIYSTQLSAITFVALPALAFTDDWITLPGFIGILLIAPIVVRFYLPFWRRLNVTTAYEYLEQRFNRVARLFGSLSFIVFQLGRMAVVIYLPALALASVTGMSSTTCIILMGVLATVYTVLGGMRAVIWTDVMQTFVLWGGLFFALGIVFFSGEGSVFAAADEAGKTAMFSMSSSFARESTWIVLIGFFFLQFGPYTTDQAVIQRYLTTPDEKAAARSIWLNGIISPIFVVFFFALGTGLWAFYQSHAGQLPVGMKNDAVLPLFIAQEFPAGLGGLVIAGVFAASMSSLDSSLHSITTCVSNDIVKPLKPSMTDDSLLRFARVLTVLLGVAATVVSIFLAGADIESLFRFFLDLVALASSGLAAMFILGIFSRRANSAGAMWGAILGTALIIALKVCELVHSHLLALIGIGSAILVGYVASLLIGGKPAPEGLTFRSLKATTPAESPSAEN